MSSLDHELLTLTAIVPDRRDLLIYAVQHLDPEHFKSEVPRNLYKMLTRYYDLTAGVLPAQVLSDLLERSQTIEAAQTLVYEGYYSQASAGVISDHEFRYSVDALKERHTDQLTGEALVSGFEIFQRGLEVDGTPLRGAKEAREYIYAELGKIDKLDNTETSPEGDMRREGADILKAYEDRKAGKIGMGVLSGIESLDNITGGYQNGELSLVCAYTNQGKSQFCTQTAWHASVVQGIGVFFATSETLRSTVMRRIVARHSRLPMFEMPNGLDSEDIKRGTLSPKQEEVLKDVVHDLETNPNYGHIYVAQVPSGATNTYVEQRMKRAHSEFDVGLGVWDYLALLKATQKRQSEREEFNQVLRESKVFSTTFAEGRGVPLISPWQIKQSEFKEAMKNGYYTLGALSDTSEAEKSPDQILSMLRLPEHKHEVTMQVLKMRDGDIPSPITLSVDYRTTFLADNSNASTTGAGFW